VIPARKDSGIRIAGQDRGRIERSENPGTVFDTAKPPRVSPALNPGDNPSGVACIAGEPESEA